MLNSGDKLRGFVGQSMGGPKYPLVEINPGYTTPGTYTFTAPFPGLYKFVLWGAGGVGGGNAGSGAVGGGSGAYCEVTRAMAGSETATIVIGYSNGGSQGDGSSTTLTFIDGRVVTAGGGSGGGHTAVNGNGGVASGGDININGSQGGNTSGGSGAAGGGTSGGAGGTGNSTANGLGGGAGAPANKPYTGAAGVNYVSTTGFVPAPGPGAGGGAGGVGTPAMMEGGAGACLINYLRYP